MIIPFSIARTIIKKNNISSTNGESEASERIFGFVQEAYQVDQQQNKFKFELSVPTHELLRGEISRVLSRIF